MPAGTLIPSGGSCLMNVNAWFGGGEELAWRVSDCCWQPNAVGKMMVNVKTPRVMIDIKIHPE
jgi:hypothetical protein